MFFSKLSAGRILCSTVLVTSLGSSGFAECDTKERQVAEPSQPADTKANGEKHRGRRIRDSHGKRKWIN
jgi:hypothetical protein